MRDSGTGWTSRSNGRRCSCGSGPALLEVRPARETEAGACRALLPEAFPVVGRAPELFVADRAGGVVGAAAVAWMPQQFPVLVRVAEQARRQGVGRALVLAAAASAAGETAALRGWSPVEEGSEAAVFMAALGFAVVKRLLVFETDGVGFEAAMGALVGRMAARLPAGVAVRTLAEASVAAVVGLAAPQLGVLPQALAGRVAAGEYDAGLSLVVAEEDALAGAMLCRLVEGVLDVDVNVVAPGRRGGWANALLLDGMVRRGRAAGVKRFRFSCEAHVRDTVNLARRCGAESRPAVVSMALRIG